MFLGDLVSTWLNFIFENLIYIGISIIIIYFM